MAASNESSACDRLRGRVLNVVHDSAWDRLPVDLKIVVTQFCC